MKPARGLPLVGVLALCFTSLTCLAVLGALALGLRNAADTTRALLRERAGNVLDLTVERLLHYVQPLVLQAAGIAELTRDGRLDPADEADLTVMLGGALAMVPQAASLTLLRPDCTGVVLERGSARMRPLAAADGAPLCESLAWARGADGLRWKPPLWSGALSRSMIAVEQPLHGPRGFAGLLVAAVGIAELSGFLGTIAPGGGQTPFILYGRDQVVAHAGEPAAVGRVSAGKPLPSISEVGDPVLARLWDPAALPLEAGALGAADSGRRITLDGRDVNVAYRTIDAGTEQPWLVGTHYVGSLGEAEMARLRLTALIGVAVLAGAVLLTLLVGRRLSRPVARLAHAAETVERQDLDAFEPLPPSRVRELDRAAGAFNHMVVGLQERQRIRDLFGRYVPPSVVEKMLAAPGSVEIGGERREVTIIFSDVAGFTGFSEQVTPETVVDVLNDYFAGLSKLVVEQGGIVVDYIGDALFAMFGAPIPLPTHAAAGLAAARAIGSFGQEFSAAQQARGVPFGLTRVGVHTGICTVGNFGSSDRLKYSAHGDMVNTASRLEGANKAFGTTVLASADTVAHAGDDGTRPVALVVLKGRSAAIEVHEVLPAPPPDWLAEYRNAYGGLADGSAGPAFEALAARLPGDPVVALHRERLAQGIRGSLLELSEK